MHFEITDKSIIAKKIDFSEHLYHIHSSIEITICTEGTVVTVCNAEEKTLSKGDIMIAFPHDIHAYKNPQGKGIVISFPTRISHLTYVATNVGRYENFLHYDEIIPWALELCNSLNNNTNLMMSYGYVHIIFGLLTSNLPLKKSSIQPDTFHRAIDYLISNYSKPLSLKEVSKAVGVNQCHLSRMFSEKIEGGFKNYLNFMRIEKAKRLLEISDMKMYDILTATGFASHYTFDRVFKKLTGVTPREYRQSNKTQQITDGL